jgi:hypothetical protein
MLARNVRRTGHRGRFLIDRAKRLRLTHGLNASNAEALGFWKVMPFGGWGDMRNIMMTRDPFETAADRGAHPVGDPQSQLEQA